MPGSGEPAPSQKVATTPTMEPLLRAHLAVRKELAAAIQRRIEAGGAHPDVDRFEEKCGGLLDRVLSHLGGLVNEAMRRGVGPDTIEAEYDRLSGEKGGIEPGRALFAGSQGTAEDPAITSWREGTVAGRAAGQYLMSQVFLLRPRDREDVQVGIEVLEKSAKQDYGPAVHALGQACLSGEGVKRDPKRAVELLQHASDLGLAESSWRLGSLYANGQGVRQDMKTALRLLETAAEAGHAEAQLELGRIRAAGIPDLPADHAEAVRWLTLAAEQHRFHAREWLDRYGAMTPREYLSRTWVDAWTPTELPPPPRAGKMGVLVSLGILGLFLAAAAGGNSLGLFLLLMFVAILVHECGHWLAAHLAGIPILVFSVGVGPLVRSFPWGHGRLPMRIDLRLLPLMGSVQPYTAPRGIWDHWQERFRREDAGQPPPSLPDFDRTEEPEPVFLHVSRQKRLGFLVGGLAVNLLLAIGCLWAYERNSVPARQWTVPVAASVPEGSVAAAAGIQEGDRFLEVDGTPVRGFFEVQRRLAPLAPSGAAGPLLDPPGTRVPLLVRRRDADIRLEWPNPAAPLPGAPRRVYGLVPPETWRIRYAFPGCPPDIHPGDEVVQFVADGRTVRASDPDAHRLLEQAFIGPPGTTVKLTVARGNLLADTSAPQVVGDDARGPSGGVGRPPFEFVPLKEIGPARGLVEVVGRVLEFGWDSIIGLPRSIASSLRSAPTKAEQGAFLEDVRRDPWEGVRTFALINAFLLFLNLVPIPPLDGFQILGCLLEMAARRPLPKRGVAMAMRAGWVILGLWLVLNAFLILRDLTSSVI